MHIFTLRGPSTHHLVAAHYTQKGWLSLGSGATGTYVLNCPGSNRVLKVGDDPGLREFANFLQFSPPTSCLPVVFAIARHVSGNWTAIWCECLDDLTGAHRAAWLLWVNSWIATKGNPPNDPFGTLSTLNSIRSYANSTGLGLDVLTLNNVMCRPTASAVPDLVFSDPLN